MSRLVYSTEKGRLCPDCAEPIAGCRCRRKTAAPQGSGLVRVGRQTQGRQGKGVTVITGLPLPEEELRQLAKELKARCGSGGSLKDGAIEIQGEHRDRLVEELKKRGWDAKRSGG